MILVIGQSGQVARALQERAAEKDEDADWKFLSRQDLDLEFPERIAERLRNLHPQVIVNAAAYTAVDKAEAETERAFKINGEAVAALAEFCRQRDIPLIHISTDYVYDGFGFEPHLESEARVPVNAYGRSKASGEEALEKSGARYLNFRTSWVYHHSGTNFVRTILRLAGERERLSIVSDQVGAPTSARDLAEALAQVVRRCLHQDFADWGTYNVAGGGETSWFEFAQAIVDEARTLGWHLRVREVVAISTAEYPTPARRPLNSRLDQQKLLSVFGIRMPAWRPSLRVCLERMRVLT